MRYAYYKLKTRRRAGQMYEWRSIMSSDYGNNYIVLTDQDGNEKEFEHIDTVDMDGETYMAFIPADLKVDEEAEVVILKIAEEDGDEILISVDDDEEADRAFDLIMQRVEDLYDEAPQESPEDTPEDTPKDTPKG